MERALRTTTRSQVMLRPSLNPAASYIRICCSKIERIVPHGHLLVFDLAHIEGFRMVIHVVDLDSSPRRHLGGFLGSASQRHKAKIIIQPLEMLAWSSEYHSLFEGITGTHSQGGMNV